MIFFFSSRRRDTRWTGDWSSDVCSSDLYILSHYRRLGCRILPGLSSVRTLHGRPYLNVTLFHSLVGQLRGDPFLNVEQMRSEERRVGKECEFRLSTHEYSKTCKTTTNIA